MIMAERMLKQVRRDGISRVRGGLLSDFSAISVPILDFSGSTYGALTIMGRYNNFDDSPTGEPAAKLKAACTAISAGSGYATAPGLRGSDYRPAAKSTIPTGS